MISFSPFSTAISEVDMNVNLSPAKTAMLTSLAGFLILLQPTGIREARANTTRLLSTRIFVQARDKARYDADQSLTEAERLRSSGTLEALGRALEKYEEVLRFRRASGDRAGEALALNRIGLVNLRLNAADKALDYLKQALPILREIGDDKGLAETFTNMGGAYYLLDKKEDAVESFEQASFLWQALDDQSGLAQTLGNMGAVYYKLNKFDSALNYATQARILFKLLGDKQGEAESLAVIEKIFTHFKQNLARSRAQNDPGGDASQRVCIAYSVYGEREKAIGCYKAILGYYRAIGFSNSLLESIGIEYLWLGDYQSALDYFEQAMKAPGPASVKSRQYLNKGYLFQTLGDSNKALANYQEGISKTRQQGDRWAEAFLLAGIGLAEFSLNRYQVALDDFLRAKSTIEAHKRENAKTVGIRAVQRVEGLTMGGLGLVYKAIGDRQKALDSFNQGLFLLRRVGDRVFESVILLNIGLTYYDAGDLEKAFTYYRQARLVSQIGRDLRGEAAALYGIAVIEAQRQNLSTSKRLIEAAIGIIEALRAKTPGQELRSSFFSSVQDYYELYIYVLIQMHKQDPSANFNTAALQASERARARALLESLGETQTELRKRVDQKLLDREQELQQKLSAKAEEQLRSLIGTNQNQDASALDKDIAALTSALQDLRTEIRIKNPKLASLIQPQPLTVKDIQQQVLDSDTLLLEYKLGDKGSYLWLVSSDSIASFEIPSRAEIETTAKRFYELLTEPNQIYRATEKDRDLRVIKLSANNKETEDAAAALSQMLLGQVAEKLGKKRLIIVADGVLQYVPFAALVEPKLDAQGKSQPLLVNHEIVSIPSASTIPAIRKELAARKAAAKTVAMLADPVFDQNDGRVKAAQGQKANMQSASPEARDLIVKAQGAAKESGIDGGEVTIPRLPGTRQEAEQILALVPSEQKLKALDFAASRMTAMSSDLSNYRIIHFATHGLVNSSNPDLSGILLSMVDEQGKTQNGFLQAHEVYTLNLPADLVVLSACQTALGKEIKGEGLVGLTRGFMYAGAASVVASLWKVNDEATADLMAKFYNLMLKDGLKPAAALRAAQLAVSREGKWDSPYYWAAFILQGEWR
jgi:CHAT domain-containing protein/tetratricopeptide (TPR) repeat protein